ncbi:hypothetical protein BDV23DRAFT_188908 [Aspergillus alliaceus]|uniref:Uncharacterized protein n=1 Tax=Petromyces alliaceus TaxID=209559 RepID=A0A5N7BSG9_PETAA|nr:hypothetical protein BDV23DRAFT_188908 [Aspergillus alliaceus]
MSVINEWLDDINIIDLRDEDSLESTGLPTQPSPPKQRYDTNSSWTMDNQKSQHHDVKDSENDFDPVPNSLPSRIALTLSSEAKSSHQRSLNPEQRKAILANATPKVCYINELDALLLAQCQTYENFLRVTARAIGSQPPHKIREILTGSQVVRPMLNAAIGDFPLEPWGVQEEFVNTEYQPLSTTQDQYNFKMGYVIGLPTGQLQVLYEEIADRFPGKYVNHVNHPYTGNQGREPE